MPRLHINTLRQLLVLPSTLVLLDFSAVDSQSERLENHIWSDWIIWWSQMLPNKAECVCPYWQYELWHPPPSTCCQVSGAAHAVNPMASKFTHTCIHKLTALTQASISRLLSQSIITVRWVSKFSSLAAGKNSSGAADQHILRVWNRKA